MVGQIISHYKILDVLGSGGMGIVYKAEDIKLHRTVALKFLPTELTSDEIAKKRFLHEAQAASSLQHNNICTIHEIDETEDGQFFIAMDYYEGETLKRKITKELLSLDEIMNIIKQTAEGLSKAHEKGIIHRDIKPANIFITKEGIVKILDFGLAKKADRSQFTTMGVNLGTTDYMSPEQIKGEKIDQRTDIWSLGTVLYEMLTGQQPFQADYEQAIVYLILNQDPEDVRKYRTDVPEKLLSILEKSLAKEREDRYEDLASMIEDLKNVTSKIDIEPSEFELPAPVPSQSIAVLPFVNMSKDPEQEYFCDGLTEELINALSKIRDLRVVARTSAFAFKGGSYDVRKIGKKLHVNTVLEGSVRKLGDMIRITAQLVNVMDGYHLWSEKYDRELKDIFGIQNEISLAIVDVLKVKLKEVDKEKVLKRYTDNIEAYNLYQQGLYFFNQLDLRIINKAISFFSMAIEKDPNYAPAYLMIGGCYFVMAFFGIMKTQEALQQVKKYVYKALEIDEGFAQNYSLLGFTQAAEYKWVDAEKSLRHGLELDPNNVMVLVDFASNRVICGDFDLAKKLTERAKNIDPLFDWAEIVSQLPDFCTNKLDRVLEHLSKYLHSEPPFWWGLWVLWRVFSLTNKKEEAVETCKKTFLVTGRYDIVQAMEKAGIENAIYTAANMMAENYKNHYTSPLDIATLYIHAGKKEETFFWLDEAIKVMDMKAGFLNVEPDWKPIRDDPRFIGYLKKMKLIK
jgi:serine/threonine protein kinase